MTAEVAILNSVGIALAADSAVTLGGPGQAKVYSSAEKIFELSADVPIAIMTYSNATYLDVPWETVVKAYRRSRAGHIFSTVRDYVTDFLNFLASERALFTQSRRDATTRSLLIAHAVRIMKGLEKRIRDRLEAGESLDDSDIGDALGDYLGDYLGVVQGKPVISGFGEVSRKGLRERYKEPIAEIKREIFGSLAKHKGNSQKIGNVLAETLRRSHFGPHEAGLVFTGFGSDDYMPQLIEVYIEGMARDRVRHAEGRVVEIDETVGASVLPFAQHREVQTFMEGISGDMYTEVLRTHDSLSQDAIDTIADVVGVESPEAASKLRKAKSGIAAALAADLRRKVEERSGHLWKPIVEMVSSLPKDEMAAMANNLVNLTKFRQRVNPVDETVGGPIDVAIITKGDGFVWVSRKHYFPAELNPRALERLRASVHGGAR